MAKECPNCGNKISDKNEGAKFCSLRCKNKYNYKHKGGLQGTPKIEEQKDNPLEQSLRGVIENEKPQMEQEETGTTENKPYKEKVYPDLDLDFADPYLFPNEQENKNTETKTEEAKTNANTPALPPMYIEKETKTESTLYKDKQKYLKELQVRQQGLEQEYKKLEEQLKKQEGRNGNELIWLGSFGGGLLGFTNTGGEEKEEKNKPKLLKDFDWDKKDFSSRSKLQKRKKQTKYVPEKQSPTTGERLLNALLYGAIGAGIGLGAKALTENYREKDKQKEIAAIKKRMEEVDRELKSLIITVNGTASVLKLLPQFDIKK